MTSILTEAKALVVALYESEVKAYEGTGLQADLRAAVGLLAGPINLLWKRKGGVALVDRGEADPGDLHIMRHLGHKFGKAAPDDPDMTLERAVGLERPATKPNSTKPKPDPGGDS